jgi:hypothetical protein
VTGVVSRFFGDVTGEWTEAEFEGDWTINSQIIAFALANATNDGDPEEGDVFYIRDIQVTQLTSNGRTPILYDWSGNGINATQTTVAAQPFIATAGVLEEGLRFTATNDTFLDVEIPSTITGTIIVATTQGTYAANITLPAGTRQMNQKGFSTNHTRSQMNQWRGMALYPRVLSQSEIDTVVSEFVKGGAVESFGSVTNFSNGWQNCSTLTSFPVINSSNGTNFTSTWLSCSSLVSFPLLNINKGTAFINAWRACAALENFPSGFFDNWSATPSNSCFSGAWQGCTSLTATSVENILNSIDTSGRNAPASGVDITISYNTATGVPDIATAVTNLKARGWTITLNGVEQ